MKTCSCDTDQEGEPGDWAPRGAKGRTSPQPPLAMEVQEDFSEEVVAGGKVSKKVGASQIQEGEASPACAEDSDGWEWGQQEGGLCLQSYGSHHGLRHGALT